MAPRNFSIAMFFTFKVLFFTLVVFAFDCPPPKPTPEPEPKPTPSTGTCPLNTLKLGVCAKVLNGLLNVKIGKPPKEPCYVEAAVCLCTAIKGNVFGQNLDIPVSLSLLLNYCGHGVPRGFQCP